VCEWIYALPAILTCLRIIDQLQMKGDRNSGKTRTGPYTKYSIDRSLLREFRLYLADLDIKKWIRNNLGIVEVDKYGRIRISKQMRLY
jgi:hypothetical protein